MKKFLKPIICIAMVAVLALSVTVTAFANSVTVTSKDLAGTSGWAASALVTAPSGIKYTLGTKFDVTVKNNSNCPATVVYGRNGGLSNSTVQLGANKSVTIKLGKPFGSGTKYYVSVICSDTGKNFKISSSLGKVVKAKKSGNNYIIL